MKYDISSISEYKEEVNIKFKLEIGDWSNDGHGKCETVIIESNKSVQEVREIYFKAEEKFKFSELCSEYGDSIINLETAEILNLFSLNVDDYAEEIYDELDNKDSNYAYFCVSGFINMFLDWLMLNDPLLELKIVKDNLETFAFYGKDDQNRHINFLGYGLF